MQVEEEKSVMVRRAAGAHHHHPEQVGAVLEGTHVDSVCMYVCTNQPAYIFCLYIRNKMRIYSYYLASLCPKSSIPFALFLSTSFRQQWPAVDKSN